MPRKPKDLGSYDRFFFDIAGQAARGAAIAPVPCADKAAATAIRHQFNRFRIALAENRHPDFEAANDLIVRITNVGRPGLEGKYVLEFVPKGLAILADETRGSRRGVESPLRDELPGLDQALKQAEQERASREEDASEAFFRNYVEGPEKPEKP